VKHPIYSLFPIYSHLIAGLSCFNLVSRSPIILALRVDFLSFCAGFPDRLRSEGSVSGSTSELPRVDRAQEPARGDKEAAAKVVSEVGFAAHIDPYLKKNRPITTLEAFLLLPNRIESCI
jgi:hypothetical protein